MTWVELVAAILFAGLCALLGWTFKPRPKPGAPESPEPPQKIPNDAIEVIDDEPTEPVNPPLDPPDYPDDDPAVVDQLSKWADDV